MLIWLLATVAGVAAAVWTYGVRPAPRLAGAAWALRALAVTGVLALLLDAVVGARRPPPPLVALDASASWLRGNDSSVFAQAVQRARRDASTDLLLFGDSARSLRGRPMAMDVASRVRPAVERALAAGRPLEIITDGELDDPDALRALPSGSSVVILGGRAAADVAVSELRFPRAVVSGDTVDADIGLLAGGAGAGRGTLTVTLGDRKVATLPVDSLERYGERLVHTRVAVPQGVTRSSGPLLLRAAVGVAGDAEPRNDTVAVTLEVSEGAAAVFVSTSPDYDMRELAAVLRGTVSLPTRGFYRVAPGVWREDGSLARASEEDVRRIAREAPLLIMDGDTAVFGDPRALARGSLLLIAPPEAAGGEWYATGTPVSPVASALVGSPWDSLPPLDVSPQLPSGDFEILETRRARRLDRRVAAVGWERPRRVVLVGASGFWRWRFGGGVGTGVHAAFWGSLIDWLSAERSDVRAAVTMDGAVREGEPVRWRRGSPGDTIVTVSLTKRPSAATDTITLRFPGGTMFAESPPLAAGVYDIVVPGGRAALVVNASRELLPRRPGVRAGTVGSAPLLSDAPRVRAFGWIFAIAIASLCGEWLLRRRLGFR